MPAVCPEYPLRAEVCLARGGREAGRKLGKRASIPAPPSAVA